MKDDHLYADAGGPMGTKQKRLVVTRECVEQILDARRIFQLMDEENFAPTEYIVTAVEYGQS